MNEKNEKERKRMHSTLTCVTVLCVFCDERETNFCVEREKYRTATADQRQQTTGYSNISDLLVKKKEAKQTKA